MIKIIVGIDPGVKTGIAVWNVSEQAFESIETVGIVTAMRRVISLNTSDRAVEIYFEDARLRTWFGNSGVEQLQGAGSIKRDCSVWQEFCEYYNIPFTATKPTRGQTKWGAQYFKKMTGWAKRTSEHARDAAVLVFGMR